MVNKGEAKMQKTPLQDLEDYFGFGYDEFIFAQLTPRQIQKYCKDYVNSLLNKEKEIIKDAFLYGYDCSGKCDNPEILAELYYSIKFERNKHE